MGGASMHMRASAFRVYAPQVRTHTLHLRSTVASAGPPARAALVRALAPLPALALLPAPAPLMHFRGCVSC